MRTHGNSPLGIEGRRRLVDLMLGGLSVPEAAARRGVAVATAHRWITRWNQASDAQQRSLECLLDRSSRPLHSPGRVGSEIEQLILDLRARTNLGPARLSHIVHLAPSTISKVLRRHGRSRGACTPRPITRRYKWAEPSALIHLDTAKLARFACPGHRTRGRSTETHLRKDRGMGHVVVHVAIDDHSRYAYVEQHTNERGEMGLPRFGGHLQ